MFGINMNPYELLAAVFGLGAILTYLLGHFDRHLKTWLTLITLALATYIFLHLPNEYSLESPSLLFGIDKLSWLFGILTLGLGTIVAFALLAYPELSPNFYFMFILNIGASIFLLLSRDLVAFFLMWELMSWTIFAMILGDGGAERGRAATKYLVWSAIGAAFILFAFAILAKSTNSFEWSGIVAGISQMPSGWRVAAIALLIAGFAVKAAIMPMHTWVPDAYAESPHPFTAFLSGVLSKLGIYGIFLAFFVLSARFELVNMPKIFGTHIFGYILAWIGALTAFGASLIAIKQEHAKRLLAWSSISQLGYILFGFGIGSAIGIAGALFHAVSHALFKTLLFLILAGVIKRTGTDKMAELGGLIKKMPLSFIFAVVGGLALAGIPMTIGFPSKWLIYEAAIHQGFIFTTVLIFAASTAVFLYYYRFVFSIFLGELHANHQDVKEVPFPIWFSYILISIPIFWLGLFPGKAMQIFAEIAEQFDLPAVTNFTATTITTPLGSFNALIVGLVFFASFAFGLLLYFIGGRTRKVHQYDTFLAGEADEPVKLHYGQRFFYFLERELKPLYRISVEKVYQFVAEFTRFVADQVRKGFFCGNAQAYLYYMTIFIVILVFAIWRIKL